MDFFNVRGSSKWNDDADDNQLHSNLFHPSTPSSPKKMKKGNKQTHVGELQFKEEHSKNHKKLNKKRQMSQERTDDDFTTIKKHKKDNSQSGKLVLHSPVRDANWGSKTKIEINPDLANDQDGQTQKKSKKKRKRKNSQGDKPSDATIVNKPPSKDQKFAKKFHKKGRLDGAYNKSHDAEPTRHVTQMTQNSAKQTKHKQHLQVNKEEDQEEEKPKKKKRRKRKPKKNKFKDEDGNLKEQYRKQSDMPEDQDHASSAPVLTQRNNSIFPKHTNGDVSRHRKKVSSQMQSTLSLQQSSDTDEREKTQTAVPATDAAKKRKRIRKRKRQNSESASEEVMSKNARPENGKLSTLESTENEKLLKPVQGSGGLLKSVTEIKSSKNKDTKNNKKKVTGPKQKAAGVKQSQNEEVTIVKPGAKRKHDMDTSDSSRNYKEMVAITKANKKSASSDEDLDEAADEVKSNEQSKESKGPSLKARLENQLRVSHFRFINEKLYMCSGEEAYEMMTQDNDAFEVYHEGYSQQVQQWPVNPVDIVIKHLNSRPASLIVGDFGCGEAQIAQTVKQKVYSFDLAALNKHVTVCDIAKVPLDDGTLDVAVFCLSLMGTNWIDYVKEANRVLKTGGTLKIAEVASRFQSLTGFLKIMKSLGFQSTSKDLTNKMFYLFDFSKQKPFRDIDVSKGEILKACLYKKR